MPRGLSAVMAMTFCLDEKGWIILIKKKENRALILMIDLFIF
jgi:hypothetical protein